MLSLVKTIGFYTSSRLISSSTGCFQKVKEKNVEKKKVIVEGSEICIAHVRSTSNNTTISISTKNGHTFGIKTGGSIGYKKSKRKIPIAALGIGEQIGREVYTHNGVRKIDVIVKGIGPGRIGAVRGLMAAGLTIVSLEDKTSFPHNGCRPKKPRRV